MTQTWIGDVLIVPSSQRPVVRPALVLIMGMFDRPTFLQAVDEQSCLRV